MSPMAQPIRHHMVFHDARRQVGKQVHEIESRDVAVMLIVFI